MELILFGVNSIRVSNLQFGFEALFLTLTFINNYVNKCLSFWLFYLTCHSIVKKNIVFCNIDLKRRVLAIYMLN